MMLALSAWPTQKLRSRQSFIRLALHWRNITQEIQVQQIFMDICAVNQMFEFFYKSKINFFIYKLW